MALIQNVAIIVFFIWNLFEAGVCRSSNRQQNRANDIDVIRMDLNLLKEIDIILMTSLTDRLRHRVNELKNEFDLQEKMIAGDKTIDKINIITSDKNSSQRHNNDTANAELYRLMYLRNSLTDEIKLLESNKKTNDVDDNNDEKMKTNNNNIELQSIVKDIESLKFDEAERKLLAIDYTMKIPQIVNKLIVSDASDFEFVLKFADKLHNIQLTQLVLVALWNALKATANSADSGKQKEIFRSIHEQIINQPNASAKQKQNARKLLQSICAEEMKTMIMKTSSPRSSSSAFEDPSMHSQLQCEFTDEITEIVIDDLSKQMPSIDLFKTIYRSKHFPNTITALAYAYTKMADKDDIALFELTNYFWNLRNSFSITYPERNLMKIFPKSLQTLYFAPKQICFKNVENDEYMYAGIEEFDNDRRYVLSWMPGDRDRTCVWEAEKPEFTSATAAATAATASDDPTNVFVFRNAAQKDEYLFTATYNFDMFYRQVFTWKKGGSAGADKQGKFALEIHGDAIAMKSLYFDDYICAVSSIYKPYKRHVLSSNTAPGTKRACQWILEDCTDL